MDLKVGVLSGVGLLVAIALVAFRSPLFQLAEPLLPLRLSSVVKQAMDRAGSDARVVAALGQPVGARWSIAGDFERDETGWTEGNLWIPVAGPKGDGVLYVRAGRARGPWVFANLEFRSNGGTPVSLIDQPEPVHQQPPIDPEFYRRRNTAPADGRYPCFLVRAPESGGRQSVDAQTTECLPGLRNDRRYDEFEIDLRGGFLVTRQTDLYVDDDLPLALTRCFRMWDPVPRAFGIGWNHPYDILPIGSRQPYTFVDLIMPDGGSIHYDRVSEGTGYADAVYEHTSTTTPFLHSEFRWNGRGWDLRFPDGALFLFPENYGGTRSHHGAPTLMQDREGRAIRFRRDADRNLEQLTSPSGRFIRLEYDSDSKVTSATDERGRSVRYTYDGRGRLASVVGGEHPVRYRYVGRDLIAIEALDAPGKSRPLLQIRYAAGRISDLQLADGRSYHFNFTVREGSDTISEAMVIAPDGTKASVTIDTRR